MNYEIDNSISIAIDQNSDVNIIGLSNINESLSTHYLIYRITNNINGKYYIGQHKTKNPYDCYMGSGVLIKEAENKYGLSNFTKEILFDYDNFESMNLKENELVQLSNCYPNNPMSYNLKTGGSLLSGGEYSDIAKLAMSKAHKGKIPHNKGKKMPKSVRLKISKSRKGKCKGKDHPLFGTHRTAEQNKHHSEMLKGKFAGKKHPMFGKHHSQQTKDKIAKTQIDNKTSDGENNANFGKHPKDWMTPDNYKKWVENKRRKFMYHPVTLKNIAVKPEDVEKYLKLGYIFGRKHKSQKN